MSFKDLKVDELRNIARHFGIGEEALVNKESIMASLETDGVTWDMYEKAFGLSQDDDNILVHDEVPRDEGVLLYMSRKNPTFEIRGYKFTKAHPFVNVKSEDADYIVSHYDGFRPALPSEAEVYYR